MQISLGFFLLLLPVAAGIYYCFPKKDKSAVMLCCSVLFFYLMTSFALIIMLSVVLDISVMSCGDNPWVKRNKVLLINLCMAKNILGVLFLGFVAPNVGINGDFSGALVILIASTSSLTLCRREKIVITDPTDLAAATMFFGRFSQGPVSSTARLMQQLHRPRISLQEIARGVMLIILGMTKKVVLADRLLSLFQAVARVEVGEYSFSLGLLATICGGLYFYLLISAYSDIAYGVAKVFSLQLPITVNYPFKARTIREHIYRMNMPLEEVLTSIFNPGAKPGKSNLKGYAISATIPFLIGTMVLSHLDFVSWGIFLAVLLVINMLFISRISAKQSTIAYIITFVLIFPAFIFLLPNSQQLKFELLKNLLFLTEARVIINDSAAYLITSNITLIAFSAVVASGLLSLVSNFFERKAATVWWIVASITSLVFFVITASFLVMISG